jgi:hypothetical protein
MFQRVFMKKRLHKKLTRKRNDAAIVRLQSDAAAAALRTYTRSQLAVAEGFAPARAWLVNYLKHNARSQAFHVERSGT